MLYIMSAVRCKPSSQLVLQNMSSDHALNSLGNAWINPWQRDNRPFVAMKAVDDKAAFHTAEVSDWSKSTRDGKIMTDDEYSWLAWKLTPRRWRRTSSSTRARRSSARRTMRDPSCSDPELESKLFFSFLLLSI